MYESLCPSGMSLRVVCWSRIALVYCDVFGYLGSLNGTVHLPKRQRVFTQLSPECLVVNFFCIRLVAYKSRSTRIFYIFYGWMQVLFKFTFLHFVTVYQNS